MLVTRMFSFFPTIISTLSKTEIINLSKFYLSSANALNLVHSKHLSFGRELTLSQTTNFRFFQTERLQKTISNLMKKAESCPKGLKTLWEKENLLVMSNFSFSHSVFKRLVLQTCKNQGLFGKGLTSTTSALVHQETQCIKFLSEQKPIKNKTMQLK